MKKREKAVQVLRDKRHSLSVKDRFRLLDAAIKDRESSLEVLGYDTYTAYLNSALWAKIRRRVYARANGKCEACGERKPENVHHWSYSVATLLGKKLKHLEAVCKICHDQFHEEPARKGKGPRQLTPTRLANIAYYELVRKGGVLAQPVDMTPRLVKRAGCA